MKYEICFHLKQDRELTGRITQRSEKVYLMGCKYNDLIFSSIISSALHSTSPLSSIVSSRGAINGPQRGLSRWSSWWSMGSFWDIWLENIPYLSRAKERFTYTGTNSHPCKPPNHPLKGCQSAELWSSLFELGEILGCHEVGFNSLHFS